MVDTYLIPLNQGRRITISVEGGDPLSNDDWRRLLMILELFRPGLVAPDAQAVADVPVMTAVSVMSDATSVAPEEDIRGG